MSDIKLKCDRAGQQYIPSNGTEGEAFVDGFCGRCANDSISNGTAATWEEAEAADSLCPVLAAFYRGEAKEIRYREDGEVECAAFKPMGEPGLPRCPHTLELPLWAP